MKYIEFAFMLSVTFMLSSLSKLVLKAQNVPILSAGVNCSFEDYVETEGRIYGGQIFCLSPSRKDVVPITQAQGNTKYCRTKEILSENCGILDNKSKCLMF